MLHNLGSRARRIQPVNDLAPLNERVGRLRSFGRRCRVHRHVRLSLLVRLSASFLRRFLLLRLLHLERRVLESLEQRDGEFDDGLAQFLHVRNPLLDGNDGGVSYSLVRVRCQTEQDVEGDRADGGSKDGELAKSGEAELHPEDGEV